jgi:hypothetical protein
MEDCSPGLANGRTPDGAYMIQKSEGNGGGQLDIVVLSEGML